MLNYLIATVRLVAFFIFIILTSLVLSGLNLIGLRKIASQLLQYWCRISLGLMGFKIKVSGAFSSNLGALVVSNHCSYMDILVLGALLPVHFTPKINIKSWPVLGFIVSSSQPIYIDRTNKRRMQEQGLKIANMMSNGENIAIFPEGTTNNGTTVYPFKSGAFAFLEQHNGGAIPVLPMSITYVSVDNMPIQPNQPSPIAWYGDATLLPHLWQIFQIRRTLVHVTLHPATYLKDHASRKFLASHCYDIIHEQVQKDLIFASAKRREEVLLSKVS